VDKVAGGKSDDVAASARASALDAHPTLADLSCNRSRTWP
jgi:hypothetical protein